MLIDWLDKNPKWFIIAFLFFVFFPDHQIALGIIMIVAFMVALRKYFENKTKKKLT